MTTYKLPQSSCFAVRCALGPEVGQRFLNQVDQWLQHSGPEWTVGRLKAIRTATMWLKSDSYLNSRIRQIVVELYRKNSISYHKGTLIPKGIMGLVVSRYLAAKKPSVLRRIDLVLRVYTAIKLKSTSVKQFEKAKQSINRPFKADSSSVAYAQSCVIKGWQTVKSSLPAHIFNEDGTVKVGEADLLHLKAFTSTHQSGCKFEKSFSDSPYGKWIQSFVTTTAWPVVFRTHFDEKLGYEVPGLYDEYLFDFIRSRVFTETTDNTYVGKITFLQEGGCKGRVVATPTAALQWAFEPLHRILDTILRYASPWSCVHAQENGAYFLMEMLGHREVLDSLDLSDATNLFPRCLQIALLNEMGLRPWGEALDEVSEGPWKAINPFTSEEEEWSFKTGQPMGLYASFPLFSLTYMCMVVGLAKDLRDKGSYTVPLEKCCRNVGDDMIVVGAELAYALEKLLTSIGADVQRSKSMWSRYSGEFAGFIAARTNKGITCYRPYKHHDKKFLSSGMMFLHAVGKGVLKLPNRRYWSTKFDLYQRSRRFRHPDLSPMFELRSSIHESTDPMMDTTRLTQALMSGLYQTGVTRNTYTGEETDLFSLECLSEILLNKQDLEDELGVYPRDPLNTPVREEHPNEDNYSLQFQSIKNDPLMEESTLNDLETFFGFTSTPVETKPNTTSESVDLMDLLFSGELLEAKQSDQPSDLFKQEKLELDTEFLDFTAKNPSK